MLTEREHLIAILGEECDEAAHACAKALRFGLGSVNPNNGDGRTTEQVIVAELNDILAVVEMLRASGVHLFDLTDDAAIEAKKEKVRQMMERAIECGTLYASDRWAYWICNDCAANLIAAPHLNVTTCNRCGSVNCRRA